MANAHLIAAAPDLYEALELARKVIAARWGMEGSFPTAELHQIESALAKARGEVQQ